MTIVFSCPDCRQDMRADDADAGKGAKCPACHREMRIPGVAPSLAPKEEEEPPGFAIRTDISDGQLRPPMFEWEAGMRRTNGFRGLLALTVLTLAAGGWYCYDRWTLLAKCGDEPLELTVAELERGKHRSHRYVTLTDVRLLIDGAASEHLTGPTDWQGTWIPATSQAEAEAGGEGSPRAKFIVYLPGDMNATRLKELTRRSKFSGLVLTTADSLSWGDRRTMQKVYPDLDNDRMPILEVDATPPSLAWIVLIGTATIVLTIVFGWITYRAFTVQ